MIVVVALIGLAIVLDAWVALLMTPWRRLDRSPTRWLLSTLAWSALVWDAVILFATLQISVQPMLALAILVGKSVVMGWWLRAIYASRQPVDSSPNNEE